jgi:hypothetical protein
MIKWFEKTRFFIAIPNLANKRQILEAMWQPHLRIEKHRITDEDFARVKNAPWSPFAARWRGSIIMKKVYEESGGFVEEIPANVADANWSYCMWAELFIINKQGR